MQVTALHDKAQQPEQIAPDVYLLKVAYTTEAGPLLSVFAGLSLVLPEDAYVTVHPVGELWRYGLVSCNGTALFMSGEPIAVDFYRTVPANLTFTQGMTFARIAVHRSSAVDTKPADIAAATSVDGIELTARTEPVEEPLIY